MKKFGKALCLLMALSMLAGCSSASVSATAPAEGSQAGSVAAPAAKENSTLRVTMALSEEEWAVMRQNVIPQFEQANNCKVEAVQVEAGDVLKKLEAMNGAKKMEIDLLAQDVNKISEMIAKGLVEDLSEYTSMIPEACMGELAASGQYDGKTYFLPYRPNAEINYYNSKYFDQYGLTVPTTWDELYTVAKTLKEKEGLGRLSLKMGMNGDAIELVEFIRGAGGDPLAINDAGSIEAFTFLQKLWPELNENTITATFSTMNGYLAKEETYYGPNWPFSMNIIVKDGGKKEILANSGYRGPKSYVKTLGGEVLGIPVGSPNKELALKFIEHLESKEIQAILMKENGWASFRSDVYEEVEEWQKPYFAALQEALAVAVPLPNVPYWGKVQQSLNDASKEIIINGADVKTTLDKYAAQVQQEVANYKA